MNPPCGRCSKAVYPTEKLSCLDKYWHKGCFSCEVCKLTLNMKTYQGFDKKPYCSMHYPKSSFTVVTDTPESLRLKEQTKLNSLALYKEEFEKNKGKGFSVVADTPEMQRMKKTQEQISNIKYHEEFEKSRISKEAPLPENTRQDSGTIQGFSENDQQQPVSVNPVNYQAVPAPVHSAPIAAPAAAAPAAPSAGPRFRALYSYTAADMDEVSLQEGDVIADTQQIDEGWMYGRVERTGQQGMLPANYVTPL